MATNNDIKYQTDNDDILISYMLLRRIIGALAFLLPIILAIGGVVYAKCDSIEASISDYYHTEMRNILVGTLCAVAMFMFAYCVHDTKDRYAGIIACFSALGIAFFPTRIDIISACHVSCLIYPEWIGITHLVASLIFFATLIYFSLVLFPLTAKGNTQLSIQKIKRNRIYRICGWVMLVCIILIIAYFLVKDMFPNLEKLKPVFVLELIALWAFGISWLTKGQFFLKDK